MQASVGLRGNDGSSQGDKNKVYAEDNNDYRKIEHASAGHNPANWPQNRFGHLMEAIDDGVKRRTGPDWQPADKRPGNKNPIGEGKK